jgi:hypothetical protein
VNKDRVRLQTQDQASPDESARPYSLFSQKADISCAFVTIPTLNVGPSVIYQLSRRHHAGFDPLVGPNRIGGMIRFEF